MTEKEQIIQDMEWAWQFCQKCLAKNPVIVLGSGASAAYGLPTMGQLGQYLIEEIEKIGIPQGGDEVWKLFKDKLEDEGLEKAIDDASLWRHEELYLMVRRYTWQCISQYDVHIHELALADPSALALSKLFAHLLISHNSLVNVVTTNYDRLIEYAAETKGYYVRTGFQNGYLGSWKDNEPAIVHWVNNKKVHQNTVAISKVHGSLDWFRMPDQRLISVPAMQEIPVDAVPVIVPPSIRKTQDVHDEPLRTILHRADNMLQSATGFFCIGYGFNDDHIQVKLLQSAINQKREVIILTKELTPKIRELFVETKHDIRFVAMEEIENHGTRIFSHNHKDGIEIEGHHVWDIRHFVETII